MSLLPALYAAAFFLLAACGEDDGEGGEPDLFLGLSGVVLIVVVGWLLLRAFSKRR